MSETYKIFEDWDIREDGVYYKWKLEGEKEWHERLTPYKEKPYVKFTIISEEELKKLREPME